MTGINSSCVRAFFLLAVIFFAGTAAVADQAGDAGPDLAKYTHSYKIPFARPVDFNSLKSLHVRVSLNGGPPKSFEVDTGSVGIVVGAEDVPNFDPKGEPGNLTYSSSGLEEDGVWNVVTVTFVDSKDAQGKPATAVVPVLAVTESKATGVGVNAGGTKGSKHPHPLMMGVGFGRGKEPHPEKNPFLNLREMVQGSMCRGYTITHEGFELGLTARSAGNGYIFQKLKERVLGSDITAKNPGLKDWETTPGSIKVGSTEIPMGGILMDTGLRNMIIRAPGAPAEDLLPEGTPITVNLLSGKLHYSFKVGDTTNPMTPSKVNWLNPDPGKGITINSGLHSLSIYDYLFDATDGYLGLRPTEH